MRPRRGAATRSWRPLSRWLRSSACASSLRQSPRSATHRRRVHGDDRPPDGRRIAYDHSPEANPRDAWLRDAHLDDARRRQSRPATADAPPGFDVEPKYSPNGRWIAFRTPAPADRRGGLEVRDHARDDAGNATPDGSIEAIRPDGGGRHMILAADERLRRSKPWFSPDGRSILFVCNNKGLQPEFPPDFNDDLCVMDSDVIRLTNALEAPENWPSWDPRPASTSSGVGAMASKSGSRLSSRR
jgi:dipeptidyl aminopeptidase/acylaminoacyl peptidase